MQPCVCDCARGVHQKAKPTALYVRVVFCVFLIGVEQENAALCFSGLIFEFFGS
jgi:hypothetical protein